REAEVERDRRRGADAQAPEPPAVLELLPGAARLRRQLDRARDRVARGQALLLARDVVHREPAAVEGAEAHGLDPGERRDGERLRQRPGNVLRHGRGGQGEEDQQAGRRFSHDRSYFRTKGTQRTARTSRTRRKARWALSRPCSPLGPCPRTYPPSTP